MALGEPIDDRRGRRHRATKQEIVDAAWEAARDKGLAGLTLNDVAARVGMRVPSLYSYFASKNEIYDAMFAQGNEEFLEFIKQRRAELPRGPRDRVRGAFRIFFDFCTSDPVRYQLLFQRTIPGFVPSESSYVKAIEVLVVFREDLAESGLTASQADGDLLTALSSGLVDQQIANDPGGDRWGRLLDEVADMAYDHVMKKHGRPGGDHD
ncbi:TetR/AcrR family transcriptional regulator [Mycobacterium sp.]|uniref:TetR/AcrR family transcriptional regulator n=1 Tax=Mycobacterium sp. TaxID=1785 RepID=UPI003D6AF53A